MKHTPLLTALGKIAFNMGALEHQLRTLIWVLIGGQEQRIGQCVTAELSFRGMVGLAEALHAVREPAAPVREQLTELLNRALKAEEGRNRFFHSSWGGVGTNYVRIKTTARKGRGLRWDLEPTSVDDVEEVSRALAAVSKDFGAFMASRRYQF